MTISTKDCKDFLIEHFKQQGIITTEKEWKRTKKYKNEEGLWLRDFEHPTQGSIVLVEDENESISISHPVEVKNNPKKDVVKIIERAQFSKEELKAAHHLFHQYHEEGVEAEDLKNDPLYEVGIGAVPGILYWSMPEDTYDNCDWKSKDMTWDTNIQGATLFIFDKNFDYEMATDIIHDTYIPASISGQDENNFEVVNSMTVEELVKEMSRYGFIYQGKGNFTDEKCLIRGLMKNVKYIPVKEMEEGLMQALQDDDVKAFKTIESKHTDNMAEFKHTFVGPEKLLEYCLVHKKPNLSKYLNEKSYPLSAAKFSNLFGYPNVNSPIDEILMTVIEKNPIFVPEKIDIIHLVGHLGQLKKTQRLFDIYHTLKDRFEDDFINTFLFEEHVASAPEFRQLFLEHIEKNKKTEIFKGRLKDHLVLKHSEPFLLKDTQLRDAIGKDLVMEILNEKQDYYKERLKDASTSRFIMVSVDSQGNQRPISGQPGAMADLKDFQMLEKKILRYFDEAQILADARPKEMKQKEIKLLSLFNYERSQRLNDEKKSQLLTLLNELDDIGINNLYQSCTKILPEGAYSVVLIELTKEHQKRNLPKNDKP